MQLSSESPAYRIHQMRWELYRYEASTFETQMSRSSATEQIISSLHGEKWLLGGRAAEQGSVSEKALAQGSSKF